MPERRSPPRRPSRPVAAPPRPRREAPQPRPPARPAARPPAARSVFQRLPDAEAPQPPRHRAQKPVAALGPGPFMVPLSTVDWLVAREAPAARYVALRDLLGKPAKDIELRKAKQALRQDLYLRDALPRLRQKLNPSASFEELAQRYDGMFWQALFLTEMGCDITLPELQRASHALFARFQKAFVDIERGEQPSLDLTLFSAVLRALAQMGHASDPRVVHGVLHLARSRIAAGRLGGGSAKDLLLFTALNEETRPAVVQRGIDFLVERAVQIELPKEPSRAEGGSVGFPTGDEPDLLELLEALARAGVARRPELEPGLALAAAKADHRGRWTLERGLSRQMSLVPEREGELSRWLTIRGLRVMQHFLGLRVGPR